MSSNPHVEPSPTATVATSTSHTTTPPPPPAITPISPTTSVALRIDTLNHFVYGSSPNPSHPSLCSNDPILVRLTSLMSQLETVKSKTGKPLTRLLDDWETYSSLLSPLAAPLATSSTEPSTRCDPAQQAIYLLSQQDELISSLHSLESIQTLIQDRAVLDDRNSKTLSRKSTLLIHTTQHHPSPSHLFSSSHHRHTPNPLQIPIPRSPTSLDRYPQTITSPSKRPNPNPKLEPLRTSFTTLFERPEFNMLTDPFIWCDSQTETLSKAFTMLDQQVLHLEQQVARLERAQKV
ncbi:uncharacterized protein UTRI_03411_B [Ustilago trichophora]|uniref:Uncharacterized protein n=1 Tax=Ustilago trichophora TaxID=86804 RepID=A0A5C3E033_9BASI|nr:uncharacterized protein UTRI_03411_B [Ustilago trichophora]